MGSGGSGGGGGGGGGSPGAVGAGPRAISGKLRMDSNPQPGSGPTPVWSGLDPSAGGSLLEVLAETTVSPVELAEPEVSPEAEICVLP